MKICQVCIAAVLLLAGMASCRPSGTKTYDKCPDIEYYMDANTESIIEKTSIVFDTLHRGTPLAIGLLTKECDGDFRPFVVTPSGELIYGGRADLEEKHINEYGLGVYGAIGYRSCFETDLIDNIASCRIFEFLKPEEGTYDIFVRTYDDNTRCGPDSVQMYILIRTNDASTIQKATLKMHPDEHYNLFYKIVSVDVTDVMPRPH